MYARKTQPEAAEHKGEGELGHVSWQEWIRHDIRQKEEKNAIWTKEQDQSLGKLSDRKKCRVFCNP